MGTIVRRISLVTLTLGVLTSVAAAQLPTAQTVILSSHPPGVGGASFVPGSFSGLMNERGVTTFSSFLSGVDATEDFGLWRADGGGSAVPLMREGDPAPGIADAFLTGPGVFVPLPIALYVTGLTGSVDPTNDQALWYGFQLMARKGDRAPGTPEGVTWSYGTVPLRAQANGIMAFGQWLTGPGVDSTNDGGVWMRTATINLVAREGDALPGGGVAVRFFGTNHANPGLNRLGTLAFRAQVYGTESGLWMGTDGALAKVTGTGDVLPGHPTVTLFAVPDDPALSDLSELAFKGVVATSLDEGLWAGTPETLRLVALANDAPPGAGGATMRSFGNPTIAGPFVAFKAIFWTAGEGVILEEKGVGLEVVAMTGQPAQGAPAGAEFLTFGHPSVNSAGQVVFQARLSGPPITADNRDGVWMLDRDGQLRAVALQGEDLQIGPTDTRHVTSIGFSGGYLTNIGQGAGLVFNDRGQILLYAAFSDGDSALVISTPSPLLIFEDGFESGNASAWSSGVPRARLTAGAPQAGATAVDLPRPGFGGSRTSASRMPIWGSALRVSTMGPFVGLPYHHGTSLRSLQGRISMLRRRWRWSPPETTRGSRWCRSERAGCAACSRSRLGKKSPATVCPDLISAAGRRSPSSSSAPRRGWLRSWEGSRDHGTKANGLGRIGNWTADAREGSRPARCEAGEAPLGRQHSLGASPASSAPSR